MKDTAVPPVKNWPLYCWRVFGKLLCMFIVGAGSILLAFIIFPPMRLILHPVNRFRRSARFVVSFVFRRFADFMQLFGFVRLNVDKKAFYRLKSKIIAANHPSLLDVVLLISLLPDAECIVRGNLVNSPLGGVVRWLYLVNDMEYTELRQKCVESLLSGSCLIVFPEGTRTPRHGTNPYKKGAARLALASGCNIVPVCIGGNDKYGLGKHDPALSFNTTEKYIYNINMLPEVCPADYADLKPPIASRRIMKVIRSEISSFMLL